VPASEDSAPLSVSERAALGRAARGRRSRRALGEYAPPANRRDPVDVLTEQEADRVPGLLPLRHERMAQTPFTFLRGAAALMAQDLGSAPSTGLTVQLCGDAHLANFGLFAAPDRGLVFDVNDFDETNPGPFEWDVMRLAASFVAAAQVEGHRRRNVEALPRLVARSYREMMARLAGLNELDEWYFRIDTTTLTRWAREMNMRAGVRAIQRTEREALSRDQWSAVRKLTTVEDGRRRFRDQPPLLVSLDTDGRAQEVVAQMFDTYLSTLLVDRAELLSRYRIVDVGHKVVGVGSVGLLAFVALMQGRSEDDLLVVQLKEAVASVLEPYTAPSTWPTHGKRVVAGQRLMQAATDAFLGWTQGPHDRSYYVRQLRDMKWGPNVAAMPERGLLAYASICGAALARAHARSGDSIAITAYLGDSDRFDAALQSFALQYAEQNAQDYARYMAAIADGTVVAADDPNRPVRLTLVPDSDGGPLVMTTDAES
jgi:uncharacterized protein (DUF2252 family)